MQAAAARCCDSHFRAGSPCSPLHHQSSDRRSVSHRRLCTVFQAAARCHYQVLGVEPTASADDVKRAFRKLALQLHPDVNPSADASEAFKAAKDAYEVLSNPQQRAAYNSSRKRQARTCTSRSASTWTGSGSSSSSTRTRQQQQGRNPFVQYMVYDYSDIEGEDMDPNGAGFYGWYAQSGSWQSSWEANKKKQQRRQQQQQQQRQAQWQQQQQWQAVAELLQQQDPQILGIVAQVYGEQLEHLTSIQELLDLLAGLELLCEEGVEPDANMFRTRGSDTGQDTGTTSRSSRNSSGTKRAASRQQTQTAAGQASSSSNSSSRHWQAAGPSRRSGTSSSRQRSSSSGRNGAMPRFEEMSFDELFAAMQDTRNPRVAKAAREFANSYHFADPRLAADVEAYLTLEFLSGDWDDSSLFAGLNANSSSSRWQHASFDFNEYAARQKYKAKPGSARDYVKYAVDDDEDYLDIREVIKGNFGYVDVDELIMQSGWELEDDDAEDGDVYM